MIKNLFYLGVSTTISIHRESPQLVEEFLKYMALPPEGDHLGDRPENGHSRRYPDYPVHEGVR